MADKFWCFTILIVVTLLVGCSTPAMLVSTGTLVGLEASPADPQTQTPHVTLAYKRSELAIVPLCLKEKANDQQCQPDKEGPSAAAAFMMHHSWFSATRIEQYIATGSAAKALTDAKGQVAGQKINKAKPANPAAPSGPTH